MTIVRKIGYTLGLSTLLLLPVAYAASAVDIPAEQVVASADAVIELMSADNVAAAKQAHSLFAAANRLCH